MPNDNNQSPVFVEETLPPMPTSNVAPQEKTAPTPLMVTSKNKKAFGGGKIIAIIFGILLLIGAIIAGVLLLKPSEPEPTYSPTIVPTVRPTIIPTATPTATSSGSPKSTASATPTATSSGSPKSTASATSEPKLPSAGTTWPTILGTGFGILIILGSLLLAF